MRRLNLKLFSVLSVSSLFLLFSSFLSFSEVLAATSAPSGGYWYRGNTHTHSVDYDKATIAGWYKNAGYDFLVMSDHETDVDAQNYCPSNLTTASFLMVCGVELSWGNHVTAFGINQFLTSATRVLQNNVTATINSGGIPILNHPMDSDGGQVSASTFLGINGLNHLEIANGQRPEQTVGAETLWDQILSATNGRLAYGVGSDDNHYTFSQAFKGWIVVKSPTLSKSDLLNNVRNGNFYASTGIVLNDYVVNLGAKTITIDSQNGNTITFIGNNGTVLKTVSGTTATYQVTGSEKYVRAKITNSAGKMAWTQPIYVTSFNGNYPTPTPSVKPTSTSSSSPTPSTVPTATPTTLPNVGGSTLHFTANENGDYAATAALGFNVHDTGMSASTINSLPAGSMAMVWVGIGASNCSASLSSTFTSFVTTNKNNSRIYGYYLTDEPLDSSCVAAVTAYTKYIHDNAPGQKSFILLTDWPGTYAAYRPAITGVDLYGLDPYPVKNGTYDTNLIAKEVNAAVSAGIPISIIVPVFQTFGGAGWDSPTSAQLTSMLDKWKVLTPNPPLDYAYSWGIQSGYLTEALINRADWRTIIAAHNAEQQTYNIADIAPDSGPDGYVNYLDYNKLIAVFGQSGISGWIKSDIIRDGKVNVFDFNKLISNFGQN